MRGWPFLLLRGTTFASRRSPDTHSTERSERIQPLIALLRPIAWQIRMPSSSSAMAFGMALTAVLRSMMSVGTPAMPSKLPAASPVGPAPTITTGIGLLANILYFQGDSDSDE